MPLGVGRIPDDVLHLIFEHGAAMAERDAQECCAPLGSDAGDIHDLKLDWIDPPAISRVSRRLYCVARSTPALWATVLDHIRPEQYEHHLRLSGSRPLTVVVRRLDCEARGRSNPSLQTVLAYARRWRHPYVSMLDGHCGVDHFVCGFSLVTELPGLFFVAFIACPESKSRWNHLNMDYNSFMVHRLMPALRMATLHNVMPDCPALSALTQLKFNVSSDYSARPAMWDLLSSCTSLRELHIDICAWWHAMEQAPVIAIASVEALSFTGRRVKQTTAFWMLRACRLPRMRSLTVRISDDAGSCPAAWHCAIFQNGGVGAVDTQEELVLDFSCPDDSADHWKEKTDSEVSSLGDSVVDASGEDFGSDLSSSQDGVDPSLQGLSLLECLFHGIGPVHKALSRLEVRQVHLQSGMDTRYGLVGALPADNEAPEYLGDQGHRAYHVAGAHHAPSRREEQRNIASVREVLRFRPGRGAYQ